MRIHSIIHASFEKLGVIKDWAIEKQHPLSCTNTYKGEQLPSINEFDFLIIMGGPQSPTELDKYPYLRNEIILAKEAIENKKIVLGICLGAQIIGEALGAKTQQSPNKEIGVYPVELTEEGKDDPLFKKFSPIFDTMHWHNDMPGIPAGAKLLAKSEGCPRQAFSYGDRVYGFQFHLELTQDLIKHMVANCENDLKPNRFVRSADALFKSDFVDINQKMRIALDHLAECV